jgi:hypothetical protein
MIMQKVKLLTTAAAAALLFGIAGASAATSDVQGSTQLAQTSDSDTGASPDAGTGGESDTGPQTDVTEPESEVKPDITTDTGTTATEPSTTTGQTGDSTAISQDELAMRADEIIGQKVVNQQGEELGEVDDLVVDSNEQPYAVVGVGGFLGIGERNVAIPASNLDFGADQVVYNGMGSMDEVKAMPEYEEGSWRSLKQ